MALAAPQTAQANVFSGPYYGTVSRVIDGDNFEATVELWPTTSATVSVRIKGIDAPELFRPKCAQERLGAIEAKSDLEELLLTDETEIRLQEVEADSFSGRVLAVVFRQKEERGRTLSELMLNRGNVVVWTGDGDDVDWCENAD